MKRVFALMILGAISALLIWPTYSYADWGHHAGFHGSHHYYRYHDHPHFGIHVSAFYPDEYYPVWVGGRRYYYDDGVYYNYIGGDYVVISPPAGAIVSAIPSDFQPMVINGVTYYNNNGTYYIYTSKGYQVVLPPSVQAAPVVTTQSIFTINVPSDKGGYTSVILKRSGNGFVGPQGEFYSEFPKVSQLKMMYGHK